MTERYEVDLTRTARRTLAEALPLDVAVDVSDFLIGPLADNPYRVGKELNDPLLGVYSARVMREWRILCGARLDRFRYNPGRHVLQILATQTTKRPLR